MKGFFILGWKVISGLVFELDGLNTEKTWI